jgi:hypothetical protein
MDIGGLDIVIPTDKISSQNIVAVLLKLIKNLWPDAVAQDTDGGVKIPIGDVVIDADMFIYQNMEKSMEWDELGAEPHLVDSMVHILVRTNEVTVVVDNSDLIGSIQNYLYPMTPEGQIASPVFKGNGRLE